MYYPQPNKPITHPPKLILYDPFQYCPSVCTCVPPNGMLPSDLPDLSFYIPLTMTSSAIIPAHNVLLYLSTQSRIVALIAILVYASQGCERAYLTAELRRTSEIFRLRLLDTILPALQPSRRSCRTSTAEIHKNKRLRCHMAGNARLCISDTCHSKYTNLYNLK
jgi:hypothetical protein